MKTIGQYYYKSINGAGGRIKATPGFEDYNKAFNVRKKYSLGESAPPAILYDRGDHYYFVGREDFHREGEDLAMVRHGFLFPQELFQKAVFGAKLYHFFDIDDFDCSRDPFEDDKPLPGVNRIHVPEKACGFLRPEDVFRQCRDHSRFVKLLLYSAVMAIMENFSIVISCPGLDRDKYEKNAVLFIRSLFAMLPWEWREALSFHSCVDDPLAFGHFRICVTPLAIADLPKNNKTFYFDMKDFTVSPDLVIEQKTRGTLCGDLLYRIWSNKDEKALSAFFYIVHHNRDLFDCGMPKMIQMDALCCFFFLTEVGEPYRGAMERELSRLSKGASREIILFLAGHLGNREFVKLREMLSLS